MIKISIRALFVLAIIILSIFSIKQSHKETFHEDYITVGFENKSDSDLAIDFLHGKGYLETFNIDNLSIPMNDIPNLVEMDLDEIELKLDKKDYRNTPFIQNIESIFYINETNSTVYIKIENKSGIKLVKLYNSLIKSGVTFYFGSPLFLRYVLNSLSLLLIFILFSFGCKKRFVISIISAVVLFFLIDLTNIYGFVASVIIYYLLIMFVELGSLSNRYIRRNNIGSFRVLLLSILLAVPTLIPYFMNMDYEVKVFTHMDSNDLSIKSLQDSYDIDIINISSLYTHYAYQKSYLYGGKYLFPKDGESIILEEFKRENHYLKAKERTVITFDSQFYQDFLTYCKSSELGQFYLNYGKPFMLEDKSFISLYINEKEYMQIAILAVTMFIVSFVFKKKKR